MKRRLATDLAARINRNTTSTARVVRIQPVKVDLPSDGDDGWDVEVRTDVKDPLDDDRDQENPSEYSEGFDWSKHDFDNDPDWR